jgi:hypothetical protein
MHLYGLNYFISRYVFFNDIMNFENTSSILLVGYCKCAIVKSRSTLKPYVVKTSLNRGYATRASVTVCRLHTQEKDRRLIR